MEQTTTTEQVFCEGRNVEEALQAACDKLNTTPNQVEYEVVAEGSSGGVLGFLRGRATKIRVWKKSAAQRQLTELLKGFFERLDLDLDFQVARGEDAYEVDVHSEASDGLLIGRGGETLAALQHLVSRMASHMDQDLRVRVDVAGYRKRRQDQLRRKARDLAERCASSGKEVTTDLLPADERRIVHLALTEDPRVETRAIGEGLTKRVIVFPAAGKGGGEGSRGDGGRSEGSRGGRARARRGGSRGGAERSGRGRSERSGVRSAEGSRSSEGGRGSERGRGGEGRPSRRGRSVRRGREAAPAAGPRREERAARAPEAPQEKPPRREPDPGPPPEHDESYFKIPEEIGIVSSPTRSEEGAGSREESSTEDSPITFGRRRRANRRRR